MENNIMILFSSLILVSMDHDVHLQRVDQTPTLWTLLIHEIFQFPIFKFSITVRID